jgi:hypothetical protein
VVDGGWLLQPGTVWSSVLGCPPCAFLTVDKGSLRAHGGEAPCALPHLGQVGNYGPKPQHMCIPRALSSPREVRFPPRHSSPASTTYLVDGPQLQPSLASLILAQVDLTHPRLDLGTTYAQVVPRHWCHHLAGPGAGDRYLQTPEEHINQRPGVLCLRDP